MTATARPLGYRPHNDFIIRELDARWRRWLLRCALGAAAVSLTLAALVGPRQATVRMRYQIAQLNHDLERLEGEQRRLVIEKETLTSPPALAGDLAGLGLEPLSRERIFHLAPTGQLIASRPSKTPAPPQHQPNPAEPR